MRQSLRDSFLVAGPGGVAIKTRLRLSERDESVLREVGVFLGSLQRSDFVARVKLGEAAKQEPVETSKGGAKPVKAKVGKHLGRAVRKKALTGVASSRWAGSITRVSDDMYERAWLNLEDLVARDRSELKQIERRLPVPTGDASQRVVAAYQPVSQAGRRVPRGYKTRQERAMQQQRARRLCKRIDDSEQRLASGRVSVVAGGKKLLRKRPQIERNCIAEDYDDETARWREQWDAARMFLTADGESGKRWGNETIRVAPVVASRRGDCTTTIRLPNELTHLSNTPGATPTYKLDALLRWNHRSNEWQTRVNARESVGYRIHLDVDKHRWYITAAWSIKPTTPPPDIADVNRAGNCLALDLNAGHIDGWVLDPTGNPIGAPIIVAIPQQGSSTTRLGNLGAALKQLFDHAETHNVTSIAVEQLDFQDARGQGRQKFKRGKAGRTTRRKIAGIPTAKFIHHLTSAATKHGIHLIAVDPAYTSKWAKRYWTTPLNNSSRQRCDGHQASSIVIGRRSQGLQARRKTPNSETTSRIVSKNQSPKEPPNTAGMAPLTDNDRREESHPKTVCRNPEEKAQAHNTVPCADNNHQ